MNVNPLGTLSIEAITYSGTILRVAIAMFNDPDTFVVPFLCGMLT